MKFWTIPAEVARILVPEPSLDTPPLLLYIDKVLDKGQPIFRSWHPLEGFGNEVPDGLIVFPPSDGYFYVSDEDGLEDLCRRAEAQAGLPDGTFEPILIDTEDR